MVAFKSLISLTVIAPAVVAAANYSASPITNLTELIVGLIRIPPPHWALPLANDNWTGVIFNISQTVDAGIELIQQAKKNGAGLVASPSSGSPGKQLIFNLSQLISELLYWVVRRHYNGWISQRSRMIPLERDASSILYRQCSRSRQS